MFFYRIAGCGKSFSSKDLLEDHFINHHRRGKAYLCSCGFIATGPRRRDSHIDICSKLYLKVRTLIRVKKQQDPEVLGNYSFKHSSTPIVIKTSHPEKYPQVALQRNQPNVLINYLNENIYRLARNQQKYKLLTDAGIDEIESGEENEFE